MGISLNGLTPANTYQSLIKVGDNSQLTATLKTLSDGFGTDLPMEVSTSGVNFTGTLTQNGNPITTNPSGISGAIQFSDGSAFASDAANLFWDDTNNRLGVGTNNPYAATFQVKGVNTSVGSNAVFVENSIGLPALIVRNNGTVNLPGNLFAEADITVGNGNTSLGARLGIKGSGTTSATTTLLVQNSAGSDTFKVRDDGNITWTGTIGASNGSRYIQISDAFGGNSHLGFGGHRFFAYDGSAYSPCLTITGSSAVSQIAVNSATPNASAVFDINSTTKGFLPPRMTTTQKNAISSPASGLMVYDTDTNKLCCYNGTSWNDLF